MSVWLVLWVIVSVVLLGFLVWSLIVLQGQKSTWKTFASKHKLRYRSRGAMDSPEVDGSIDGYKVDIFTSEHTADNARSSRKLTAIEISLHSVMPVDGAVASAGMIPLVKELGFKTEVRPEHELWNRSYMAAGDNARAIKAYLTPERLDAIIRLMRIKHSWIILIFRAERMLLRIDTPDPLTSEDYLDRLIKLLIKSAKTFELKSGESGVIEREEAKGLAEDSNLTLDDGDVAGDSGLALEEDEYTDVLADDSGDEAVAEEPKAEPEAEEKPKKKTSSSKKKSSQKKPPKKS